MTKRTSNNLQNNTQKTEDRTTRTPLKTGLNSCAREGLAVPDSLVTPVVVNVAVRWAYGPMFLFPIVQQKIMERLGNVSIITGSQTTTP